MMYGRKWEVGFAMLAVIIVLVFAILGADAVAGGC